MPVSDRRASAEHVVHQLEYTSEIHGGFTKVVYVGTERSEPAHARFDFLAREAACFLSEFVKGCVVQLTYTADDGIAATQDSGPNSGDALVTAVGVARSRAVGGEYRRAAWSRLFELHVPPRTWRAAASDHEAPLPSELSTFVSAAERIATRLQGTLVSRPTTPPEAFEALSASIPDLIVSLVAAELALEPDATEARRDDLAGTIRRVVRSYSAMAATAVEHRRPSHTVVVRARGRLDAERPDYAEYLALKRAPAMASGTAGILVLDRDGRVERLHSTDRFSNTAPESTLRLASAVGVTLDEGGLIAVSARGAPLAVRRGTRWAAALFTAIRNAIAKRVDPSLAELLASVAVRHTTCGQGGLICITNDLDGIAEEDQVVLARSCKRPDEPAQWLLHRLLPTDSVFDLPSNLLTAIVGMDGATVISPDGVLLAYGAIVPLGRAGLEGARATAARHMSHRGLALKISEDGPLSVWSDGEILIEA